MTTTLRPMSTGQVLDRTFNLYRRNFVLFFGIATVPPALMLVMQLLPLAIAPLARTQSAFAASAAIGAFVGVIVFFVAWILGYSVAQAATVFAVSAVHLDRQTSISESYSRVRGRYGRVLNVVISIFIRAFGGFVLLVIAAGAVAGGIGRAAGGGGAAGAMLMLLIMPLVIAAGFVGLYFFLRYAVAVQACVLEDIKARAALARSVQLTKGDRGRIFVIFFLTGVLNYILAIALVYPATYLGIAIGGENSAAMQILNALSGFVAGALSGPIATIAMSLIYYDERVRKEAFDLQLMMAAIDKPGAAAASAATS